MEQEGFHIIDPMVILFFSSHTDYHPEKKGRIVWVSGPPGSGKSATCQLIARENNYVYYEADCMQT